MKNILKFLKKEIFQNVVNTIAKLNKLVFFNIRCWQTR